MSTDTNTELLITGKQYNELFSMQQDPRFIELCRDRLAVDGGNGITVFGDNRGLTSAQLIRRLPDIMFENDVLLSFVNNPVYGSLNQMTQMIRNALKSPPVFDGKLKHWSSPSIVSPNYAENKTTLRDLFSALEDFGSYAEERRAKILDADFAGDLEHAENLGLDMLGVCSPYRVSDFLAIGQNGNIFRDITEIPYVAVANGLSARIASGVVIGAALGMGRYESASVTSVLKAYLEKPLEFSGSTETPTEKKRATPKAG